MSILRDDRSVARQEVLESGWSCVDHLDELATSIDNPALERPLAALATAKRDLLEELAAAVRRAGELPVLPDRDRETLEEFVDRVSGWLVDGGSPRALLRPRLEAEQRLAELIDRHLGKQSFTSAERDILERLRNQSGDARETLGALVEAPDNSED
ncbi:hypothetical protein [Parahaliea mediterranea]|uniref:Uncharacterized protein n=1 Tax=Parahaliea mediterranea TaxID=651086 RepID=A0A939DHY7_9GAMM|nr:hypothetical protein [Parahaliea mediterranea]MBN7798604.1 hypothetical protein [Parahaliea mediterranea]